MTPPRDPMCRLWVRGAASTGGTGSPLGGADLGVSEPAVPLQKSPRPSSCGRRGRVASRCRDCSQPSSPGGAHRARAGSPGSGILHSHKKGPGPGCCPKARGVFTAGGDMTPQGGQCVRGGRSRRLVERRGRESESVSLVEEAGRPDLSGGDFAHEPHEGGVKFKVNRRFQESERQGPRPVEGGSPGSGCSNLSPGPPVPPRPTGETEAPRGGWAAQQP